MAHKSLLVSSALSWQVNHRLTVPLVPAWGITQGHSVLCKSKTPSRIRSNLEGDFRLSPEDMKKIESIDKKLRFNDSSTDFGYNLFADLDGKGEVFAM